MRYLLNTVLQLDHVQSLKAEFEQHDAYIADLDKDVATFREQGKAEAANRLENQLAVLKVLSACLCLQT